MPLLDFLSVCRREWRRGVPIYGHHRRRSARLLLLTPLPSGLGAPLGTRSIEPPVAATPMHGSFGTLTLLVLLLCDGAGDRGGRMRLE